MEPFGRLIPVPLEHTFDSEAPCWKPNVQVDARVHAFTYRLLRDFHHQWRYILRNNSHSITLRALARAMIRLLTLDFDVYENTGGHGLRGVYVWITHLPAREPFKADVVRIETIWVIHCQDVQKGLSIAQWHVESREICSTETPSTTPREGHAQYMSLSVKRTCCATLQMGFHSRTLL